MPEVFLGWIRFWRTGFCSPAGQQTRETGYRQTSNHPLKSWDARILIGIWPFSVLQIKWSILHPSPGKSGTLLKDLWPIIQYTTPMKGGANGYRTFPLPEGSGQAVNFF